MDIHDLRLQVTDFSIHIELIVQPKIFFSGNFISIKDKQTQDNLSLFLKTFPPVN